MERSFKIRSKSEANVRKKIYEKIKKHQEEDQFSIFLNKEIDI
jgi:hypothetical protein